jgi:hypothetical protein
MQEEPRGADPKEYIQMAKSQLPRGQVILVALAASF